MSQINHRKKHPLDMERSKLPKERKMEWIKKWKLDFKQNRNCWGENVQNSQIPFTDLT